MGEQNSQGSLLWVVVEARGYMNRKRQVTPTQNIKVHHPEMWQDTGHSSKSNNVSLWCWWGKTETPNRAPLCVYVCYTHMQGTCSVHVYHSLLIHSFWRYSCRVHWRISVSYLPPALQEARRNTPSLNISDKHEPPHMYKWLFDVRKGLVFIKKLVDVSVTRNLSWKLNSCFCLPASDKICFIYLVSLKVIDSKNCYIKMNSIYYT